MENEEEIKIEGNFNEDSLEEIKKLFCDEESGTVTIVF